MKKPFLPKIFISLLFAGLCLSQASAQTIYLDADFNGTTLSDYSGNNMAQLTKTNLDAGTTTGDWTVNQAQSDSGFGLSSGYSRKSIQGESGGVTTNKVLAFGSFLDGSSGAANPFLTANLTSTLSLSNAITFDFDYAGHAPDGNTNERGSYLTGIDGSGNRLFQLFITNTRTDLASPGEGQNIAYIDSAGATQFIGSAGDINSTNDFDGVWDSSIMKTVSVSVGASDYSISLGGSTLATGIAFRDASASGLASIELATNNNFTSGWIDNMEVSQVPEPGSFALIGLVGGLLLTLRRRS